MQWNQLYLLTFYLSGYVHCAISVSMCDLLYYLYWGSYLINKAVCFTHYIFRLHSLSLLCMRPLCLFVCSFARACMCVCGLSLSFFLPSFLSPLFVLSSRTHTQRYVCVSVLHDDCSRRLGLTLLATTPVRIQAYIILHPTFIAGKTGRQLILECKYMGDTNFEKRFAC